MANTNSDIISISKTIDFDGILNNAINKAYRYALDAALAAYTDWLETNSPRGATGELAGSWQVKEARKVRNQLFADGSIVNTADNAYSRIVGRAPGKQFSFEEGSALQRWCAAVGIPPYVVMRKIANEGTRRWRSGKNILGQDPRTGAIDLDNDGIKLFNTILEQEMQKVRI